MSRQQRKKRTAIQKISTGFTYVAALAIFVSAITVGYQSPVDESQSQNTNASILAVENPSLDQLIAAGMAAETASVADLSIAANAENLSTSLSAKNELAQSSDTVLVKPQVMQGENTQRGISEYKVVRGDTVESVAKKFEISTRTLKWANGLYSDALNPGSTLLIPSTDGVIYKVDDGDTAEKLAKKYQSDAQRIITYNDLEVTGLTPGSRIVIPDGILPSGERPQAPEPTSPTVTSSTGGSASTEPTYGGGTAVSVGNRYAAGNCTWYAYERRAELGRPVGSFWGNAATWASFAAGSGFTVNKTPAVGSIMQDSWSAGGYGHVAIVEAVNPDGSILLSEMNYAGWNVISSRTISAGQVATYNYIH